MWQNETVDVVKYLVLLSSLFVSHLYRRQQLQAPTAPLVLPLPSRHRCDHPHSSLTATVEATLAATVMTTSRPPSQPPCSHSRDPLAVPSVPIKSSMKFQKLPASIASELAATA